MSTFTQARPGDEVTVSGFDGHIGAVERYRSPALNLDIWQVEYPSGGGPPTVLLFENRTYAAESIGDADANDAGVEQQAEPAVLGSAQFELVHRKGRRFGRCRFEFRGDATAVEVIFEQSGRQTRIQGRRLAEGAIEHFPA